MQPNLSELLTRELQTLDQEAASIATRRRALADLLATYNHKVSAAPGSSLPGTLEMAKIVLRKAGKEMRPPALRMAIQEHFKTIPAPSLPHMLYKKQSKGKDFYKLPDGSYGLLEWKAAAQPAPTKTRIRRKKAA